MASQAYARSPLSVLSDVLSVANGADVALVAGVPGKRIKVLSAIVTTDKTTTVHLKSNGTDINNFRVNAAAPIILVPASVGYGETAAGEDLDIAHTDAGNTAITYFIQYVLID